MVLVMLCALGSHGACGQCQYELTAVIQGPDCGIFGPAPIQATAINDHGVVVGHFNPCITGPDMPFMWSEEMGFVAIPLPPGVLEAEPRDINNNGEIVGRMLRPELGYRAFRYKDGEWNELPPTGDGNHSEAFGINDNGWVVGYRDTDDGLAAFRWRDDDIDDLVSPISGGASASDINLSRVTSGLFGSPTGNGAGFVWDAESVIEIPPLIDGTNSEGESINEQGAVAGSSRIVDANRLPVGRRSWLFENILPVELGLLPGTDSCRALAINNVFQVVGRSSTPSNEVIPFLWQHGDLHDLNAPIVEMPNGFSFRVANGLNNFGQVVGQGWLPVEQDIVLIAVVISPTDSPLGDANIDCVVDEHDLKTVLDDWGSHGGRVPRPSDMVTNATFQPPGDGVVDGADLAVVLGNWSTSTEAPSQKRRR